MFATAPLAAQGSMGMDKDKMAHGGMGMSDTAMKPVKFMAAAPHMASGSYQMMMVDGKHMLKISDDFTSSGSPDAYVYLAMDGKVDESAMELGRLSTMNGGASFNVRDDKKAMRYNTVVIYSKAHKLPIATAPLTMHDGMMKHDGMMMNHDTGMKKAGAMDGGGTPH